MTIDNDWAKAAGYAMAVGANAMPWSGEETSAISGPWQAVLHTAQRQIRATEITGDEDVFVSVVRATAAPVDGRMPSRHLASDVLFRADVPSVRVPEGVDLAMYDVRARWAQARVVAALLNAHNKRLADLSPGCG